VTPSIRVKICGITNRDDALAAIDAGADALGFNLFPGSKRHVLIDDLTPWLTTLPPGPLRVAVMVNPTLEEILRIRNLFDVIQLHGQETPAFCAAVPRPLWKALPIPTEALPSYPADALLIDSSPTGGSGLLIDLDRAARFVRSSPLPVWLAGGLTPANVAEAVQKVRPHGIDVATGVESHPRRKDPPLLRAVIAAARRAA
jgi:phosphoribosylanthranilate isomerase